MPRATSFPSELISSLSEGTIRNIDRVLRAVRMHLGMDVAFVSEFMGTNRIFRNVDALDGGPIRAGGIVPLAVGYCRRVVEGQLPELIPNTMAVPAARVMPETHSVPIGAHLCVPIRLSGGELYGTFCCFSYLANPLLDERALQLMRTFAEVIARQIEQEVRLARERQAERRRIVAAMRGGDPAIVYQPICRLSDGQITGVEALARFTSTPKAAPDAWFAAAGRAGVLVELELLAIRKAIAGARSLPAELTLSLNASPQTVLAPGFGAALEALGLSRAIIEVTEHQPVKDYPPFIKSLAPLRAQGTRVAVDDAGSGYASMRHVLSLRPDIIKLDVSLTRGIDADPTRYALGGALVEFARRTGASLVAEGIETAGELKALRELGIEQGQGYYLCRPIEMRLFLELFERSGGQIANLAPPPPPAGIGLASASAVAAAPSADAA